MRAALDDDEGSILPLTFVYAALTLILVLVCTAATSLYLAQRKLDAAADAASLAGADGFTLKVQADGVSALLTDAGVRVAADGILEAYDPAIEVVEAATPDGQSARVTLTTRWEPPVITLFLPDGVQLTSTSTTRTVLR